MSGFGSIRWEDQERIRKKISGEGGSDATDGARAGATGKGKKKKMIRSDLKVEYAKSSRSTCKGCNSQIMKVIDIFNYLCVSVEDEEFIPCLCVSIWGMFM